MSGITSSSNRFEDNEGRYKPFTLKLSDDGIVLYIYSNDYIGPTALNYDEVVSFIRELQKHVAIMRPTNDPDLYTTPE